MRLPHRFADGAADLRIERHQARCLAVGCDRHVRRRDVEPDVELGLLRCLRDGVGQPAAEGALVVRGFDLSRDRRAVYADGQARVYRIRLGPGLDYKGNRGVWLGRAKLYDPARASLLV